MTTVGVVAAVYDRAAFSLGEAVSQVLDVVPHKHGIVVWVDVAAANCQAARDAQTGVRAGGDQMLHFCEDSSACKDETDRGHVLHLGEWKVLLPAQLDETYLSAAQRIVLSGLLPTSKGVTTSDKVDDDEDKRGTKAMKRLGAQVLSDSSPAAGELMSQRRGKDARYTEEEDDAGDD